MTKRNNNKNKNKQNKKRQGRKFKPEISSGQCSLVCPTFGVMEKYPDGCGSKSLTTRETTRFNMTTGASGYASALICPGRMIDMVYKTPTIVGGNVTDWGPVTHASGYSSVLANICELRIVSCTISVRYIGSSFYNAGGLAVKGFTPTTAAIGPGAPPADVPINFGDFSVTNYYGRAADGGHIVCDINDEMALRHYSSPSDATIQTLRGLKCYALFIHGGDTGTPQNWEVVVTQNVEVVPDARNFLARMATDAPPRNPGYMERISKAFHSLSISGQTVVPFVEQAAQMATVAASLTGRLRGTPVPLLRNEL